MTDSSAALEMKGITKEFPGTVAVDDVDFEVHSGEVHALIGENGAGKSTLMKTIAGTYDDYEGRISLNGQEVDLHNPATAKENGIGMVYQELSLAQEVSIAENILAGNLPKKNGFMLDQEKMVEKAETYMNSIHLNVDPMLPVGDISQHEQQLVEIAKVLSNEPDVMVFDEPTSALSREEVSWLFEIIDRLKDQGMAIIYISHHLSEVFTVADRVTVLRNGKKISTEEIQEVTSEELVRKMVGTDIGDMFPDRKASIGDERFQVNDISRYGFFHDIDFSARKGEILGVVGLTGAGRSEMARSICGLDPLDEGEVLLNGEVKNPSSYGEAIEEGIIYLTENRKEEGLGLPLSIHENIRAPLIPDYSKAGFYFEGAAKKKTEEVVDAINIIPPDPSAEVGSLSGGNQQKVLLGKWLTMDPEVLILDEPTRGVDVGTKKIIHDTIGDLADQGITVILISSDLPELAGLSDRAIVLRRGHLIGEMEKDQITEENVLLAANAEGDVYHEL